MNQNEEVVIVVPVEEVEEDLQGDVVVAEGVHHVEGGVEVQVEVVDRPCAVYFYVFLYIFISFSIRFDMLLKMFIFFCQIYHDFVK